MAQEKGVVRGRKMRVDTTVVQTNIHYPTDSSLLGDGARALTRTDEEDRKGSEAEAQGAGPHAGVNKRARAIAMASRQTGAAAEERRQEQYRELVRLSRQILNDAKRVMQEMEEMSARRKEDAAPLY